MLAELATTPLPTLQIGAAIARDADRLRAVADAAVRAREPLDDVAPEMALVVTAGVARGDVVATVRRALGPVGVAGGAAAALLTDEGPVDEGALVICLANAEGGVSGVAATSGRDLADAGSRAARLILAGWPFRSRYPRGLGVAFACPGYGGPGQAFLPSWRMFVGPKLRTVCSVMSFPAIYGAATPAPLASVGCVEAPYATGLGWADGFEPGDVPDPGALIQGTLDATLTALKRLQGGRTHLVLVVESSARVRALGEEAEAEWSAVRAEVGERTPCVGWVCEQVAAYGRGVQPLDATGSLVAVGLGDPTKRE